MRKARKKMSNDTLFNAFNTFYQGFVFCFCLSKRTDRMLG